MCAKFADVVGVVKPVKVDSLESKMECGGL